MAVEKEEGVHSLSKRAEERRKDIYSKLIEQSNDEISANEDSMTWLRKLGSDLNINAFAINWYREDGKLNTELEEANYLMRRVVNRLSVTTTTGNPNDVPLFLTSTQFEPALYGQCAQNFMSRLGLTPCAQDLWVLRNVVMSPFPTDQGFMKRIMELFEDIIIDEVRWCRDRNSVKDKNVEFLLRGTDAVFLDFQTSFHAATQRQQIILAAKLQKEVQDNYTALKNTHTECDFVFSSDATQNIEGLIKRIEEGETPEIAGHIKLRGDKAPPDSIACKVQMVRIVKSRPLNSANRDDHYPRHVMPFYLYGSVNQFHISHMLLQAPNVNLSACDVKLELGDAQSDEVSTRLGKGEGLILTLTEFREETMHPFPPDNKNAVYTSTDFFFQKGKTFKVKIYEDPNPAVAQGPGLLDELRAPIARGKMALGNDVHVDAEELNKDPLEVQNEGSKWDKDLDLIGETLDKGRKMVFNIAPPSLVQDEASPTSP